MTSYEHNIADYRRDTEGLSLACHGAYRLLMDIYYETGKLTDDDREWMLATYGEPSTREAIAYILDRFFARQQNGRYIHKRIERELARQPEPEPTSKKAPRQKFVPPTPDEWRDHCQSLRPVWPIRAIEAAFGHYESNGWKVGKNPMKDWKAAARTCHLRWLEQNPSAARADGTKDTRTTSRLPGLDF